MGVPSHPPMTAHIERVERAEFVEKAGALGVELKSAMSSVDEVDAERLRKKFGGAKVAKKLVTEKRVERGGGGTVIRRRKKKIVEPPPEPALVEATEPAPARAVEAVPETEPAPIEVPEKPVPAPAVEEIECTACSKKFKRKSYGGSLNAHKDKSGYPCYGRMGVLVDTKY